jgi:hypothetical protein
MVERIGHNKSRSIFQMKHSTLGIIPMIFLLWLVWGPIIINSQPGSTFFLFGIDWKADNLDNTMFWVGLFLMVALGVSLSYQDQELQKHELKVAGYKAEHG